MSAPTDSELDAARRHFADLLRRTVTHLAKLRDQAEQVEEFDGPEARALRESIQATRDKALEAQAELSGFLAATDVEIEYRKLRGEWRGSAHAPH